MNTTSKASYLENRVRTASQPQIHLMLIEGALRFGQQARQQWNDESLISQVDQLVDRVIDIVEELVHSTTQGKTGISKQLEEQYAFLYRELALSRVNRDLEKFKVCLKLLEFQRETWRMACEWIESQPAAADAPTTVPMPHMPFTSAGGFSVEA
jgi:flagellar protein FliS